MTSTSSRILTGSEAEAAKILWRPGNPPRQSAATSRSADPGIDSRLQEAYQQGFASGQATAAQRAGELAAPVLTNFASIVQQLASAQKDARKEAEEPMVRLAIAIARRILHREIATDPAAILGLVRSGMERLNLRETHRLRLSPGDAQIVIDNREDMRLPSGVEIIPDPDLPPGSAIFETARGELDISAHTQLEEIERGFTDLIVQRRR